MENKKVVKWVAKKDPDLFLIFTLAKVVENWSNLSKEQKTELANKLDLSTRTLYRYFSDYQKNETAPQKKKENQFVFDMIRVSNIVENWDAYTVIEKEAIAESFNLTKQTIDKYINTQSNFDWKGKKEKELFKKITVARIVWKWDDIPWKTKAELSEDFDISIRTLYRYISDYNKNIDKK